MKICSKCKMEFHGKTEDHFYRDKANKDGFYSQCKTCKFISENTLKRKTRDRKNYEKNRAKILAKRKAMRAENHSYEAEDGE